MALASIQLDYSINHGVLNQQLSTQVSELDFSRLKHKYTAASEAEFTEEEWDFAELEYRRFLELKKRYPKTSLVPNKLVDKIWHAHILDTKAYREDCDKVFGKFIDHYPYFGIYGKEDESNLSNAFQDTIRLYEMNFGPYPSPEEIMHDAARCADHACHAPSECACRVPGACK